jgi:hypothetical protein
VDEEDIDGSPLGMGEGGGEKKFIFITNLINFVEIFGS